MQHLLAKTTSGFCWASLLIFGFLFLAPIDAEAQRRGRGPFNYDYFQKKNFYFGITLGYNQSFYHVTRDESFILNDSVQVIESVRGPGFNLGIITNIKFGEDFDLRFMLPTLSFADRRMEYQMTVGDPPLKKVESVFLEFPIQFRYKSKVYKDTRIFVVAGAKYSIDLASNSRARQAEDLLKIHRNDFVVEVGIGFQIFFPYFILSPEIKFSHGVLNIHDRDPNLIFSSPIDKLFSRGIAISFHFEG